MRLEDGFSSVVQFTDPLGIELFFETLWEKRLKPPGIDGGGAIDTTTMRNDQKRTKYHKSLSTTTDLVITCAYDTAIYEDIYWHLQQNQLIEFWFSDWSTIQFWGWLDKFDPQELVEGEQPECELTIIPSNQDNNYEEEGYIYYEPEELS